MKRFLSFCLFFVFLAMLSTACAVPLIEEGSKLICPKYYIPGISVCRAKTDASILPDENELEYSAVFLQADEIGVYKDGSESYATYQGVGFHPTPADFVRVYKYGTQKMISDTSCTTEDETKCIGVLGNVTLKGQAKFSASYGIEYSMNYSTKEDLLELYEVGGLLPLMTEFNDYSRDTFRGSRDLDPKAWLDGTLTYDGVAVNWLEKLKKDPHMTGWKYHNLFSFKAVTVRYFEPDAAKQEEVSSGQAQDDMNLDRFIVRRDKFCSAYLAGSSYRLECERTFVCSEKDGACYFGGSVIPIEDLPTATPPAIEATPTTQP